eukprot:gene22365-28487_t
MITSTERLPDALCAYSNQCLRHRKVLSVEPGSNDPMKTANRLRRTAAQLGWFNTLCYGLDRLLSRLGWRLRKYYFVAQPTAQAPPARPQRKPVLPERGATFTVRLASAGREVPLTHPRPRAVISQRFAQEATKAGRYGLENGNTGSQPYTPAPLQADCHEIHETAATLLATLGQPIFEPLTSATTAKGIVELFYCKGSGADGVGEYTTEGFVVHKGSKGRVEIVPSIQGTSHERMRSQLITEGVLTEIAGSAGSLLHRRHGSHGPIS